MKALRSPTLWGAGALAIGTVLALVASWFYVSPPGQKVVTFYTQDAAAIRPGDEVRIAGIHVGKVKDVALQSDQIRVRTRIDDTAFVGDQSQVEVRMLTVVGGYYVSITSLGDVPLGAKPIPLERTTMPYNLMRTLTDATKLSENIRPQPINESLNQIQQGLSGSNEQVISSIVDAGNSVMSTIDRQRGQVTKILDVSNEYIHSLNDSKDLLRELVRKASILEASLALYADGFGEGIKGLGEVVDSLDPVGELYLNHRDRFLDIIRDFQDKARFWAERNGVIIRALRLGRNKIERVLDAQNAPPELLATDLCMPIPGRAC